MAGATRKKNSTPKKHLLHRVRIWAQDEGIGRLKLIIQTDRGRHMGDTLGWSLGSHACPRGKPPLPVQLVTESVTGAGLGLRGGMVGEGHGGIKAKQRDNRGKEGLAR